MTEHDDPEWLKRHKAASGLSPRRFPTTRQAINAANNELVIVGDVGLPFRNNTAWYKGCRITREGNHDNGWYYYMHQGRKSNKVTTWDDLHLLIEEINYLSEK